MTFTEALEVLGLSDTQPVTQEAVRKAYVALIKVHKPERDPEAFQRVREAYDRAKEALTTREQGFTASELRQPAPSAEVPPASADAEILRAAQHAVDQAEDDRARIPLLLEAIAQHPREASLRWQLIDAYHVTSQLPLAENALREGAELELPGFLETLAHEAPLTITHAQLEKLRGTAPLTLVLRVAVARKDQAVLTETLRTLEGTQETLSRRAFVNLALYALEREDVDSASRVLEFVGQNHARFTREPGSQIAEACARDLVAMRDELPHTYLKAFVQGVRFGQANDNVILYREHDPELAEEVYAVLQKHSEPLAKLYAPLLPSRREVQAQRAPGNGRWQWGLVVAIVLASLRFLAFNQSANSHTSQRIDIAERIRQHATKASENAPTPVRAEPSMSYPLPIATLEEQRASVATICTLAPQHCEAAEALQLSTEEERCMLTDATDFARATRGIEPRTAFQAVHHAALRACGVDTRGGAR